MFQFDKRLGISIPCLLSDWASCPPDEQKQIMHKWESVRGTIPDRIQELESIINKKQSSLDDEDNFTVSCQLNTEISELASIINDLWIWFRTVPDVTGTHESAKQHS